MSDYRDKLAREIRSALGELNNDYEPVVTLVRDLRRRLAESEARVAELERELREVNARLGVTT